MSYRRVDPWHGVAPEDRLHIEAEREEEFRDRERTANRSQIINRFVLRQSKSRQWVSFASIIDWFARDEQGKRERRPRRHQKTEKSIRAELWTSLQDGEFDVGRKGLTLALLADDTSDRSIVCRFLSGAARVDMLPDVLKEKIFIPNAIARSWFANRNYRTPVWIEMPSVVAPEKARGAQKIDAPIIEAALQMIEAGKARSANDAAVKLAPGHYEKYASVFGGSPDGVRDRLQRKIAKAQKKLLKRANPD